MTQEKIRRTIFDEVSLCIAIIGATFAIIQWVQDPQKDMELKMKDVEASQMVQDSKIGEIVSLREDIKALKENLEVTNKNVVKLSTIIEERMPK